MNELQGLMRTAYSGSMLSRIGAFWRGCWETSVLRRLLVWLMSLPYPYESSRAHGRLDRLNRRLAGADSVRSAIYTSRLQRIWAAIARVGRESRLLGWVFREGATGVLLLILALYTPIDYFLRDVFAIPVVSSGWDEGLLLFALVWVLVVRIKDRPALPPADSPLDLPVAQFLAVCLALFILRLRLVRINIAGFRATAQYILWFFIATRLIRSDRLLGILYGVMVAVAAVIALHGIYQFIVAVPIPEHWVDQAESTVRTRVFSIFGSPNIMGDFMVMFAPMAAALAYFFKNRLLQLGCWLAAFTMCFSCLFTMSRGAWVAMVLAIFLFALLVDRRLIVLMLAAFALALFLPFVATRIGYLFTSDYAASSARGGRSVRWEQTIHYLHAFSPAFGIGFGMFGGAVAMQNPVSPWMKYFYTDNYYIKILAENGYVGLVSFILMMVGVVWTGLRGWFRQRHEPQAPLCAGTLAGLCGVLAHCYFENIFEEPYMAVCFWTIAAMMMYLGFIRDRIAQPQ
ncbi:MAG: O-antigen ligase family protein [Oscillospiraceae bacterium]|nr:O-antigen ligase family protein [Oscillospiraceae bacterium]